MSLGKPSGFSLADEVPDATTVWLFRKQLIEQGLIEALFEQFDGYLVEQGYAARGGQIVDATLIPVPKQHNSDRENQQLKQGEIPQAWQDKPHQRSSAIEEVLELMGFDSQIHERSYRNRPLTEAQHQSNRTKSKTRSRVEHVFGAWIMQMGGKLVRVIGMVRVKAYLGLKNLTYNLMRYTFLQTQAAD